MKIINVISSLLIFISTFSIVVIIFSQSKRLYESRYLKREVLRVGLLFICFGSLWNFLDTSIPPKSEVILNVGVAIVSVIFLINEILKIYEKSNKENCTKR